MKMKVWQMKGYGDKIEGSAYFRAFCPECLTPVRITQQRKESRETIFCEDCNPCHKGCSSPLTPLETIDADPDMFMPSWRNK